MRSIEHKAPRYVVFNIPHLSRTSQAKISSSGTLFSNTLWLRFSLNVCDQVSHPYKTTGKIRVLYILIFTIKATTVWLTAANQLTSNRPNTQSKNLGINNYTCCSYLMKFPTEKVNATFTKLRPCRKHIQ